MKHSKQHHGVKDRPNEDYLAEDNINKAVEISCLMDDNTIMGKMRYMTAAPLPTPLNEDIFEVFKNISTLKKTTEKKDSYLIYAMNYKEISRGESYVFKTSVHHLKTAYKMDPTKKTLRGKVSLQAPEKAYFDAMHKHCCGYKMMIPDSPPSFEKNAKIGNDGS